MQKVLAVQKWTVGLWSTWYSNHITTFSPKRSQNDSPSVGQTVCSRYKLIVSFDLLLGLFVLKAVCANGSFLDEWVHRCRTARWSRGRPQLRILYWGSIKIISLQRKMFHWGFIKIYCISLNYFILICSNKHSLAVCNFVIFSSSIKYNVT